MKKIKDKKGTFWLALGTIVIVAAFALVSMRVSSLFRASYAVSSRAPIPPELQSANIIEFTYQLLPEPKSAPGSLKIPIFVYHSVRPDFVGESQMEHAYSITPELFEQQLSYLQKNGYTAITPDQLASGLAAGTTSPVQKPVLLTFDDGWENQYNNAFPLLKKYHMTATFYVYTNAIGVTHFLTWPEIKEMDAAGMIIGDHTLSHPNFKKTSLAQIQKEVTDSKKILEDHLGKPVVHFASPFGYTNPDIIAIVGAAGYRTARTTYKGVYHTAADLLHLRSILVSESFGDFVKELNR